MDLFNPFTPDNLPKEGIEVVQKQKQELTFLGSYLRKRTHKLYAYDMQKSTFVEVVVNRSNTIHLQPRDGKLVAVDLEMEKAMVDPRKIYFEALNDANAQRKVDRWKAGEIKELFNLRKYDPNATIKFY